jgi:hypothetical protein
MKNPTPFSRRSPKMPPRGKIREWRQELALPTRLEIYVHGLVERNIAAYGFWVWDVGENRLIISHGAVSDRGQGIRQEQADLQALTTGLEWIVKTGLHRRKTIAYTDSLTAFQIADSGQPVGASRPEAALALKTIAQFSQLSIQLVNLSNNRKAIELAVNAYVNAQELQRMKRVPEVLSELRRIGPQTFLVGDRYRVDLQTGICTCPDFQRIHSSIYPVRCKHLLAAIQFQNEQDGKS